VEGSCEALELSVGEAVEVADCGEELDVGVGVEVGAASSAFVHGF